MDGIEIYLRQSGDRVLLNIYVPKAKIESFLSQLKSGSYEDRNVPMAFEADVLSEWRREDSDHIRVPVTVVNLQATD